MKKATKKVSTHPIINPAGGTPPPEGYDTELPAVPLADEDTPGGEPRPTKPVRRRLTTFRA